MMSNFDGSLKFDTAIDTSGITNGLRKISELAKRGQQALEKMTLDGLKVSGEKALEVVSKLSSVGLDALTKSIDGAVAGTTELAGSMGAVVGKSVEIGQSFESSMSQVMATMGKTKDSIASVNGQNVNIYDTLSNKAKELGASTQFSASEVADAFNYMALAGWDVEKQLSSIDGILDLSAASGLELGTTCDIVTDYLSAFGMSAEQSGQMADMMAYAQSNANLSVSNLAESWKNCAANMNANGQSIETTTALLSKMADQGFKGSEAGTALTAMVRDMSNSMQDGAIKIGDTSVAVADAEGNYRDLTDILADVDKAVGSLPETARTTALSTTFTSDSIKAMNLLLNAGVDNVKNFENNLSDMSVIEGFASNAAQTMNDNLEGDLKSLSSASEGVSIAIFDKLSPSLRELAQNGTKYLQEFNSALNAEDSKGLIDFASSIGDVLAESLKDNEEILQNATLIGSSFMNALIDGIRNNQDKIAQSITKSIQQGVFVGEKVFTNFYNLGFKLVSSVSDGLAENPELFTNLVADFITNISSTFSRYSSKLAKSGTTILKAVLKGIEKSSKSASKDIALLVSDIAEIIVEEIPEFVKIGTDIIAGLLAGISEGMSQSDVSAKGLIDALASGISNNSETLLECAWTIISALGRGIGTNLPQLAQYALDIVLALTGFIGEHANEIADGALDLILALADTLITEENLTHIGNSAIKLITNFASGISNNSETLLECAWTIISALGRGIGTNLPQLAQYALDIVLALTGFIGEHANEIADGALDLILALADTLITEENLTHIGNSAIKLITNFASGLTSEENMLKLSQVANNIIKTITDTLFGNSNGSSINDVLSAGANIGGQLLNGLTTALFNENGGIFKILDTLVISIGEYLSENFWSLGTMVMEGFMSGVTGIDFSFEDFREYMYDTTHSGNYWQNYFSGLGTALKADANTESDIKAYFDRGQGTMTYEEYLKAMEDTVAQNSQTTTDTATFCQNVINKQDEKLGLLSDKFEQFLNQKQTIQVSLYENSDAFAEITATGVNLANAKNGGY